MTNHVEFVPTIFYLYLSLLEGEIVHRFEYMFLQVAHDLIKSILDNYVD